MSFTGLLLTGFVFGHLAGNLQMFAGPEKINSYAAMLQSLGPLLWVVRGGLLLILVVHVKTAAILKRENRAARPVSYYSEKTLSASLPSRTMILSGITLFLFIIYHLLHYTTGQAHPDLYHFTDSSGRHDVYQMIVTSFSDPVISGVYITAMLLLAFHLYHGFASAFQSLGIARNTTRKKFEIAGIITAVVVFGGNSAIPLAVLMGWIK